MQQTIHRIIAKNCWDGTLSESIDTIASEIASALQNESQVLTCIFCGEAYPPGTPPSNHEALNEHIKVCPKHPLRGVIIILGNLADAVEAEIDMDTISPRLSRALTDARRIAGTPF